MRPVVYSSRVDGDAPRAPSPSIFAKLGVTDRTKAVVQAIVKGLV
jgi:hypothetical protein